MKRRLVVTLIMVVAFGIIAGPALAANLADNPAMMSIVSKFHERSGEAMPQAIHGFLFDVVSNNYSNGWGSIVAMTNYDLDARICVYGVLVPQNATPDDAIFFHVYLNPAEVKYINIGYLPASNVIIEQAPPGVAGLDNKNGWLFIYAEDLYFGSGVLIYNTTNYPGMIWEDGWSF